MMDDISFLVNMYRIVFIKPRYKHFLLPYRIVHPKFLVSQALGNLHKQKFNLFGSFTEKIWLPEKSLVAFPRLNSLGSWNQALHIQYCTNTLLDIQIYRHLLIMFHIHIPIWQHGFCIHLAMATKPPSILINSLYPNNAIQLTLLISQRIQFD